MSKGQAAGAAVLLAIIAALLIAFVIFIPPADREELLGTPNTTTNHSYASAPAEASLLRVNPGRIDYLGQKDIEHPLPVVNIYTRTESKLLAEKNLATAKRALFSQQTTAFRFTIDDLANTNDVLLHFDVRSLKGNLKVSLNGDEILNEEVVGSPQPISIPKNNLQQNNEIVFAVSSPGIAFWATNEAIVENIKIVGDVTNLDATSARHVFLVSDTEKRNLQRVAIKFQPECRISQVGKLTIELNAKEIYSAVPDCDVSMVPIEVSPIDLHEGENQLVFRTAEGTYILSHIQVKSELKELEFPTYYFELSNEQYNAVHTGSKHVRLNMEFVDVISRKFGELVFNGHQIPFDSREVTYTADLSDDVVRGNNAVKIKPQTTIEVRELKVDLVK